MLGAAGAAAPSVAQPVTGTLYPLGVDLREHPQMLSAVCYAVLVADGRAELVRQTWSRFKVAAIQGDERWLLFPDAAPWLESLAQGKALDVQNIGLLPSGDLVWDGGACKPGQKYKLIEIAARYFARRHPPRRLSGRCRRWTATPCRSPSRWRCWAARSRASACWPATARS